MYRSLTLVSDLRKFRDEQGHYLRERHRALCGTLLNPRTIYRRVTSRFFIHGCSMTKNLLLGSIAGNFLPVEDRQRCANPHVSHRALPEVWVLSEYRRTGSISGSWNWARDGRLMGTTPSAHYALWISSFPLRPPLEGRMGATLMNKFRVLRTPARHPEEVCPRSRTVLKRPRISARPSTDQKPARDSSLSAFRCYPSRRGRSVTDANHFSGGLSVDCVHHLSASWISAGISPLSVPRSARTVE